MVQFEDELRSSFQLLEKKIQVQIEDYGAASARQSRHITEQDAQLEVIKKELNVIRDNLKTDSSEFKNELRQFALDEREKVAKGGEETSKYLSAYSAVLGVIATIVATIPAILSYMTSKTFEATSKIRLEEIQIAGQNKLNEINKLLQEGKSKVSQLETLVDENTKTILLNTNKDNKENLFSKATVDAAHKSQETGVGRDVLLGAAVLAQDQKKWAQAYSLWHAIFSKDKKDSTAVVNLAIVSHQLANITEDNTKRNQLYGEAQSLYLRSLNMTSTSRFLYMNLVALKIAWSRFTANKERKMRLLNEAEEICKKMLDKNKNNVEVKIRYLGTIFEKSMYLGLKKNVEALEATISELKKYIDNNNDWAYLIAYGKLYLYYSQLVTGERRAKYRSIAEDALRMSISINNENEDGYETLAILKSDQAEDCSGEQQVNLWKEADELYQTARKKSLFPIFIEKNLYAMRCRALASSDGFEYMLGKREKILMRLRKMNPEFALYDLACVAALRGKKEESIQLLLECKEYNILPHLIHIQEDKELDSLRDLPEFKKIIDDVYLEEHGVV